jgi:hypothetical protein
VVEPARSNQHDLSPALLAVCAVFLLLAATPARTVPRTRVSPAQVAQLRISFVAVALAAGCGYLAVYLSGSL